MFTGIVRQIGVVGGVTPHEGGKFRLTVDSQGWTHKPGPGDSIAVNGCCLTVVELTGVLLAFDAVPETLANTRGHVVAIVGYLANEGTHATVDVPAFIAAERAQRGTHWPPVHDLGSIGGDAEMARLIVEQVTAAR